MNTLIMAGQMILALSILISLHELGHYLAARAFGIKVEKFYLFFDAWGIKLFSFKYGDTEYGIGWLPLGGYVKIAGMIDESMDTQQMKSEPQPWEFRSKPAWQRLIVMLAGVTVNVVLGIVIFSGMTMYYGETFLPAKEIEHGISTSEIARKAGLQDGDYILRVNGKEVTRFDQLVNPSIFLDKGTVFTVKRNDSVFDLPLPKDLFAQLSKQDKQNFISYRIGFAVETVDPGTNAFKAGIQDGDSIVMVNDSAVHFYHELRERLYNARGTTIPIVVARGGKQETLKCDVEKNGTIGFRPALEELNYQTEFFGFAGAVSHGSQKAFKTLAENIRGLGKVFSGEVDPTKSLMGPIRLATVFGINWIWERFWGLTALLSMVLAFMNVLPIPALDGGHALFLTIEMIIGRPLGDKFLQVMQVFGMIILLALMIFVFGNDIWNLIAGR